MSVTGLANDAPVATWGNRNEAKPSASMMTESRKPLLKTSVDGYPAVLFDGVDDYMTLAALSRTGVDGNHASGGRTAIGEYQQQRVDRAGSALLPRRDPVGAVAGRLSRSDGGGISPDPFFGSMLGRPREAAYGR